MEHDLSPAYIQLNYHSSFAPHKALLPTRAWLLGAGTHGNGGYEDWGGGIRDADDMVKSLCTKLAEAMPASVHFDTYIIFTKDGVGSPSLPRAQGSIGTVGGILVPSWNEAVQKTFTFYDTGFNVSRLVLLDCDSGNDFSLHTNTGLTSAENDIGTEWANISNAWASRAGLQPFILRTVATKLNDKLRKSYHIN